MWLINCSNYALKEFLEEPKTYAILSHTWGKPEDEVSFQQMTCPDIAEKLAGYSKIKMCCQTASEQDIEWVWIDTCCIDKSSSSALQEAINSMFRWYQKATICYAYLSDVPGGLNEREREGCFHESRWFSRGWTLQELIAPQEVWFYDQTWTKCGTKIGHKRLISEITGIQQEVLEGTTELSEYSVAQKMCWASRRITTRQEDMAYCLLGIFDINMSLIYGEGGPKAFIRLQEQIMQDSDDQSIFAWESELSPRTTAFGLLANSPALFKKSGEIIALRNWHQGEPFSMTNRGLRLHLPRLSIKSDQESDEQLFQGALACQFKQNTIYVVGILLMKILDSGDQYIRKDGSLYPIPIDIVQSKIMRNFGLPGAPLDNYDYTQDMYKWIYVKKSIQYPKQEDLTSPGDLKGFRVTFLEGVDSTWTVSSYPRTEGNILPIEIAPPQAVKFRWNPEVWSWHAVLLFTETLPTHFPASIAKGSFYLVIGWNGATGEALEHLGTHSETAQAIHEKYSYGFPEQLRNVVSLEEGYGGVDGEVRISQIEVKSRDGGKEMREVVLNVKLNRPTLSVLTVPESVSLSPQPKKPNWLRKKLMR